MVEAFSLIALNTGDASRACLSNTSEPSQKVAIMAILFAESLPKKLVTRASRDTDRNVTERLWAPSVAFNFPEPTEGFKQQVAQKVNGKIIWNDTEESEKYKLEFDKVTAWVAEGLADLFTDGACYPERWQGGDRA